MSEIIQTSPYSCTSDNILAKYFRYHNNWQLSSSADKIQDYYVDKLGNEKLENEKCMNPFLYFPRKLWDFEKFSLGFKQTLVFPGFSAWSRITAKDYIRQLLSTDDKLIEIYKTNPRVSKNIPIFCTENGYTNVGKNINHLCWHPNVTYDTQILACLLNFDSKNSTKNDGIVNILQIWDYGNMNNFPAYPIHKYSLMLDWGKIIKMLWVSADVVSKNNVKSCEYRNHNAEGPQELYGHMLFVCADGTLKIIPIAKFSAEEVNTFDFIESESAAPHMVVLEINHANVMHLGMSTSHINDTKTRFGYPTCVDWKSKFASMLLVGFSSGFVAIFDLSVAHHTRYDYTNNYLAPVLKKRVSYSSVIAVSFSPIDWKQFNVTVAPNPEGTTNFNVNIASNFGPINVLMSDKPLCNVIWPNRADILIAVPSTKNKIIIKSILSHDTVEVHINKITSISVCDLLNSIIVSTECGSLLSINLSNPSVVKALIEPSDSIDLTSVPSHIKSYRYNIDTNKKGENLKTFIVIKSKADLVPLYDSHKKIEYPTICSMSINPNINGLGYVAVAFDNGITNVLRFLERDISPSIQSLIKSKIQPEISSKLTPITKVTKSVNIKTIRVVPVAYEKKRYRKLNKGKDSPDYDPLDQILYPKQSSSTPSHSDYKSNSPASSRKVNQIKKESYSKTKRISKRSKYKIFDTESDAFSNISDTFTFSDQVVFHHNEDLYDKELDINSSDSGATERMTDSCTDYDLVHEDNTYNEEFKVVHSLNSQCHLIEEENKSKISDSNKNEKIKFSIDIVKPEKKANFKPVDKLKNNKFIQKSNIGVENIEKLDENIEFKETMIYSDMSVTSDNCFSMDSEENICASDKIGKIVVANMNLDLVQDFSNSMMEEIDKESGKRQDFSKSNNEGIVKESDKGQDLSNSNNEEIVKESDKVQDLLNSNNEEIVKESDKVQDLSNSNNEEIFKESDKVQDSSNSNNEEIVKESDNVQDLSNSNNEEIVKESDKVQDLSNPFMEEIVIDKVVNENKTEINDINMALDSSNVDNNEIETFEKILRCKLVSYSLSNDSGDDNSDINSVSIASTDVFPENMDISKMNSKQSNDISKNEIEMNTNSVVEFHEYREDKMETLTIDDELSERMSSVVCSEQTEIVNLSEKEKFFEENEELLFSQNSEMNQISNNDRIQIIFDDSDLNVEYGESYEESRSTPELFDDNTVKITNLLDTDSSSCSKNIFKTVEISAIDSKSDLENQVEPVILKENLIVNEDNTVIGAKNADSFCESLEKVQNNWNIEKQLISLNQDSPTIDHRNLENQPFNIQSSIINLENSSCSEKLLENSSSNGNDLHIKTEQNITDLENMIVGLRETESLNSSDISYTRKIMNNEDNLNLNKDSALMSNEEISVNSSQSISSESVLSQTVIKNENNVNNEIIKQKEEKTIDNEFLLISDNCASKSLENKSDIVNSNKDDDIPLNIEFEETTISPVICENDCESIKIEENNFETNENHHLNELEARQKCLNFDEKHLTDNIKKEIESNILVNSETIKESPDKNKSDITSPLPINIKFEFKITSVEINIPDDKSELPVEKDSEKHLETVESNFFETNEKIINVESIKNETTLTNSEKKVTEDKLEVEVAAVNYSKQKSTSVSNNVFQFLNKIQQTYQSTDEKDNEINLPGEKCNVNDIDRKKQDECTKVVINKQTSPLNLKMNSSKNFSPMKEKTINSENKSSELFTNTEKSDFIVENNEEKTKFISEAESTFIPHGKIDNENFDNIIEKAKISNNSEIDKPSIYGIVELINTTSQNSTNRYLIPKTVSYKFDKSILHKQNFKKSVNEKLDKLTKILPKNENSLMENVEIKNKNIKQENLDDVHDRNLIENQSKVTQKSVGNNELDSDSLINNIERSNVIINSVENIKEFTHKILSNMPKILPKSKPFTKISKTNKPKDHDNKSDSFENELENNQSNKSILGKNLIASTENDSNLNEQTTNKETPQKTGKTLQSFAQKMNKIDLENQKKNVKEINEKKTFRKRTTNYSFDDNMENSDDKVELRKTSNERNNNKKIKLENTLSDTLAVKHLNNDNDNTNKRETEKKLSTNKKSSTESVLPLRTPISRLLKPTFHSKKDNEPVKKLKTINQYKSEMLKSKEIDLDEKVNFEENSGKDVNNDESDKQKRNSQTKSHFVNRKVDLENEISLKSKKRKLSSVENCKEKIKQIKVEEPVVTKRISARLNKQSDIVVPESSTVEMIHDAPKLEVKSNFSVSNSTNSEESTSRKTKNSKSSSKKWWHDSVISIEWLDVKYKGGHQTIKGILLENEPVVDKETLVRWPRLTCKQYPAIVRQIYYGG